MPKVKITRDILVNFLDKGPRHLKVGEEHDVNAEIAASLAGRGYAEILIDPKDISKASPPAITESVVPEDVTEEPVIKGVTKSASKRAGKKKGK